MIDLKIDYTKCTYCMECVDICAPEALKYNGALNIPFTAIASNTNVSLNPVSIMLVQDGEAKITITPVRMWSTYIALNLGNAKIWWTTIAIK